MDSRDSKTDSNGTVYVPDCIVSLSLSLDRHKVGSTSRSPRSILYNDNKKKNRVAENTESLIYS